MPAFKDLTGMEFGKLTAIDRAKNGNSGETRWNYICECGKNGIATSHSLVRGSSKSCGCTRIKNFVKSRKTHGQSNRNKTITYTSWATMIQRCNNENHRNYDLYGGRGIEVCERWRNFELFFEDMGERPSKKHSLDRKDVNKGYEKSNCKWSTQDEQMRNTRKTKSTDNGVHWDKQTNKWRAKINVNNKSIHIGRFSTKEEAILARKEAEIKYWGKSS